MADGQAGSSWTEREVQVVLDAYFQMLLWELDGRAFVKADVRGGIGSELPARSNKSIEFKWCNVSAVLDEMDLPWIQGYRPLPNYQRSLVRRVDDWLNEHPDVRSRLGH